MTSLKYIRENLNIVKLTKQVDLSGNTKTLNRIRQYHISKLYNDYTI